MANPTAWQTSPCPSAALGGSLSVLRAFRLLRVFKLARSWKELNRIINTIGRSVVSVGYLSVLLLLLVFVFALMGLQIFGHKLMWCDVEGAVPLCPPGLRPEADCPPHPDCYVACSAAQAFTWFDVEGAGRTLARVHKSVCAFVARVCVHACMCACVHVQACVCAYWSATVLQWWLVGCSGGWGLEGLLVWQNRCFPGVMGSRHHACSQMSPVGCMPFDCCVSSRKTSWVRRLMH